MADSNKLYITISDGRGEGNGTPTPQPEGAQKKDDDNILGRYVEHQVFHLVKQQATQFVNFSINNIGNFTGDYIAQRQISVAKQAVEKLAGVAMTTIAGAKYGWVGAIVGFAVGVTGTVASGIYDTIQSDKEMNKTNYSISQLRERAGLNSVQDGSRGTEN